MLSLLASTLLSAETLATAPRPNIILIMADDMGFSDIGCYGGEIHTPNLDRMASGGLRFTQFYNNAKCTTTRASLLSGMYPRGNGNAIPLNMPTLAEVLRPAGYQTGMSGKWHLGSTTPQRPYDRGFQEYYGLMDGACNFFNPAQRDPAFKGSRSRVFGRNDQLITSFPSNYYTTDAFTDHSIQIVRQFAKSDEPFFLHLAYTAPHYPLHARPEDIARYRGRYGMGWEELRRQRLARQNDLGLFDTLPALSGTDSKAYDWATANQDWEDHRMAVYAAMVDRMDQNIGRLLVTLEELGIENDTILFFLSDNGGCSEEPGGRDPTQEPGIASTYTAVGPAWGWAQNAPFRRYKSWVHEGGITTPLIVYWPGRVKAATITSQVGHIIDLLPTCLDLAGTTYPAEFNGATTTAPEGRSLLPILLGGTREPPRELCWEWKGNCAIRRGQWKLVWDTLNPAGQWELYNLQADRTEMHDLADQEPTRVAELSTAFTRWATATGRKTPPTRTTPEEADIDPTTNPVSPSNDSPFN